MSYWKPIDVGSGVRSSCPSCPPRRGVLRYKDNPDPGFGVVSLRRNGELVESAPHDRVATTVREWRALARRDLNHDWTIEVDGPMSGVRYTRQSSGRWVSTHRSRGFA